VCLSIVVVTAGRVALCLSRSLTCSTRSKDTLFFLLLVCIHFSVSLYCCCHYWESFSLFFLLPCSFYSTILYALLCLLILQSTIRCITHVNITTNDLLCSLAILQATMICALLCLAILQTTMRSALPVDILTDNPRLSSLAILQPIVFRTLPGDITADYPPLYSACRYYN
jgi:hypothetical protein